jgi:hypothetical protein
MGNIVFDVDVAPGCAPATGLPEFVMVGVGDMVVGASCVGAVVVVGASCAGDVVVVGASCAGTCSRFEIDGAVTARKLLAGVGGLTDGA